MIHPTDPDIVYFGAVGNLWAGSEHRGVFKSTDGGQNWDKVLFVDQFSGVIDMAIDPHNPNTIYAATYQRLRRAPGASTEAAQAVAYGNRQTAVKTGPASVQGFPRVT